MNMAIENYLIIENNVVTNIVLWDGNEQTWLPPANSIVLCQATTPTKDWKLDSSFNPPDYVLTEYNGGSQLDYLWDGTKCVTNLPKPPTPVQPSTEGTQEL